MTSDNVSYENRLLAAVHKPILRLLLIVAATFVFWRLARQKYSLFHFYTENADMLKRSEAWCIAFGVLVLIVMYFIDSDRASQRGWDKRKFFAFIFLSVVVMAIVIFLTGGFLDSPFSAALALYLGCFILLQKDDPYKVFNLTLLIFTFALVVGPYVVLYWFGHRTFILEWDTSSHLVTCGRLIVSLVLLISAGYFGDTVAEEVRALHQDR